MGATVSRQVRAACSSACSDFYKDKKLIAEASAAASAVIDHAWNKLVEALFSGVSRAIRSLAPIAWGFILGCFLFIDKLQPTPKRKLQSKLETSLLRYQVWDLLKIVIYNVCYARELFPICYFYDEEVHSIGIKIKKLMPIDPKSQLLIDWMEKGVYDALQKKYLKTLLFCICETQNEKIGPMIEEYSFSFSYSNSDSQEVAMTINRSGNKEEPAFTSMGTKDVTPNQMRSSASKMVWTHKGGLAFTSMGTKDVTPNQMRRSACKMVGTHKEGPAFTSMGTKDVTPNQMRNSACKMVWTLLQFLTTFERMPEKRTVLMKLQYYDATPAAYVPPLFRMCTYEETKCVWKDDPVPQIFEVGRVSSKPLTLVLKLKTTFNPWYTRSFIADNALESDSDSTLHEDSTLQKKVLSVGFDYLALAQEQSRTRSWGSSSVVMDPINVAECNRFFLPAGYVPPLFRICTCEETKGVWKDHPVPQIFEVGRVSSKPLTLGLKLKTKFHPCYATSRIADYGFLQ